MGGADHARRLQSGSIRLFGSDIISDQAGLERGNGYSIAVTCDNEEQVKEYYDKLVAGGTSQMEPGPSPWGGVFGQCSDKFGVQWMLDSNSN